MDLSARWIWIDGDPQYKKKVCHFRREFHAEAVPDKHEILVSADSVYQLYVNGRYILRGPCKGDSFRKYVDRVNIASYLKSGRNTIAALAAYFPNEAIDNYAFKNGPTSVISTGRGGFLLAEDKNNELRYGIGTDEQWLARENNAYAFRYANQAKYAGDLEEVDGNRFPFDWYLEHADTSEWKPSVVVSGAESSLPGGVLNNWQLKERDIPLMSETEIHAEKITKVSSSPIPWSDLIAGKPVTIPERRSVWVEIDVGYLTTAYIRALIGNGAGSTVKFTYAESYIQGFNEKGGAIKAIRDDTRGQLWGESDSYFTKTGVQYYEPLAYRTFRFIRLDITTGEQPLTLHKIVLRETGYPLELEGDWVSSDPEMQSLWDISIRTLRRCMHDSYIDSPYYEQMQYTMDTMLQMLFTYQISRDDRLARKAIHDFHSSLMPDGMIACNWPAKFIQVIPGFAFYWIRMLEDHYMHYKDPELVHNYLPTVDQILRYFEARMDPHAGLVKSVGYWQFVDWTEAWSGNFGSPIDTDQEVNVIYNMMFVYGLKVAERLNIYAGYDDRAAALASTAARLKQAIRKYAWSEEKGLFQDAPRLEQYSQHAQLWAVLSEIVTGDEARQLMHSCMTNPGLAQCSFSMSFFLFRALEKVQLYRLTETLWTKWLDQLDNNVTTWPEDLLAQRSDCHAWGAVPIYEFTSCILGVKPLLPGYEVVGIKPCTDYFPQAEGVVATQWGPIKVKWEMREDNFCLSVRLPRVCKAVITLPDATVQVCEGEQDIHIVHTIVSNHYRSLQNREAVQ